MGLRTQIKKFKENANPVESAIAFQAGYIMAMKMAINSSLLDVSEEDTLKDMIKEVEVHCKEVVDEYFEDLEKSINQK